MARRSDMHQGYDFNQNQNRNPRSSRTDSDGRVRPNRDTAERRREYRNTTDDLERTSFGRAQVSTRRPLAADQRAGVDRRRSSSGQGRTRAEAPAQASSSQHRLSVGSRTQGSYRSERDARTHEQRPSNSRVARSEEATSRRSVRVAGEVRTGVSDRSRRYRSAELSQEEPRPRRSVKARGSQQQMTRQVSEDGSVRRPFSRGVQEGASSQKEQSPSARNDQVASKKTWIVSRETIEEQITKRLPSKETLVETLSDREALAASAKERISSAASKAQETVVNIKNPNQAVEFDPEKEKARYVLPSFFMGLIVALLVLGIVLPDMEFSPTENRQLQTFPEVSAEAFVNGTFQSEFQTYVEDQFPLRDMWVTIKSVVSTLSGRVENNGVYRCADGTLILEFDAPENDTAAEAVVKFIEAHKDEMKIYTLISPTAAGIWSDKLPSQVVMDDQKAYLESINSKFTKAGARVVDVWKAFEAKKAFDLFYRTDHHWTTYGAQLAYMNLANALDMNVSYKTYNDLVMTNDFAGSLTAQGGYFLSGTDELHVYLRSDQDVPCVVTYASEKEKASTPYVSSALDQRDAYEVFFGGNHSLIEIDSYAENSKGTLLVIKDSYANSLIPFLIGDYERIIVVDPRYYTEDLEALVSSNSINDVLFLYNATTFSQDTSLGRLVEAGLSSTSQNKE